MGRPRKHNRHLPRHLQFKHGGYYYVHRSGRWEPLGHELGPALKLWAEREAKPSAVTRVGEAIDAFLVDGLSGLSPRTQSEYRRMCCKKLRKAFGDALLADVKPANVAQYLAKRSKKKAGNREISVLSSVYAYAMRLGWVDSNPCYGVRRNPERARTRIPSDAEVSALLLAAGPMERHALILTLLTGLRMGDLLRLSIADCTARGLEVTTSKTGKRLCFPWNDTLRETVDVLRGNRQIGPLILSRCRRGFTSGGWSTAWAKWFKRAGVQDLHWHDLRAYALTWADRLRGREYARRLAAHAQAATTDIYLRDRGVVEVEPLPEYWTGRPILDNGQQ